MDCELSSDNLRSITSVASTLRSSVFLRGELAPDLAVDSLSFRSSRELVCSGKTRLDLPAAWTNALTLSDFTAPLLSPRAVSLVFRSFEVRRDSRIAELSYSYLARSLICDIDLPGWKLCSPRRP